MRSTQFREDLVDELSEEIAESLSNGARLEDVRRALSTPGLELGEDELASLRLFARSYADLRRRLANGRGLIRRPFSIVGRRARLADGDDAAELERLVQERIYGERRVVELVGGRNGRTRPHRPAS
jgi:hypothetical protein